MRPVRIPAATGNRETPPPEPAGVGSLPSHNTRSGPNFGTWVTLYTAPGLYVSCTRIAVATTELLYSSWIHSFWSSCVAEAQAVPISPKPCVFGGPVSWRTPHEVSGVCRS